jgi:zinc protease
VKPEAAFDLAAKHYGAWKRGSFKTAVPSEPPQKAEKRLAVDWPVPTQPYLYAGYHGPAFSATAPDLPALDLASQLLFSESAPLYQRLMVEEQVVDLLSGGAEDHRDPYLFTWVARVKRESDLPRVEAAIAEALEGLKKDLVPKDRLAQVTSHLRYGFAMQCDTPSGAARGLAHYIALTSEPESVNQLYATYEKVTPEQIRDVARKVFVPSGRTIITLRHAGAASASEGSAPAAP